MTPEELRAYRTRKNLTQAQLAALTGHTERQVRRWEAGTTPVPRLLELYIQGESKK
jgi:DNA-binding transcriptional regulator YiaG